LAYFSIEYRLHFLPKRVYRSFSPQNSEIPKDFQEGKDVRLDIEIDS
jgi:hypothetical protein